MREFSNAFNVILTPFRIWWRLFTKNRPALTDAGAKNIWEKLAFWILTAFLPFAIVFIVVYSVDFI